MRRTLCALVLVVAATACQPTGHPKCDQHIAQLAVAGGHGFRFDCYPTDPGYRPGTQIPIAGWADISNGVAYIWPNHITAGTASFSKVMWHELGHLRHHQLGGSGRDEVWADAYAWCRMPASQRVGLSFHAKPTVATCRSRYLR